jgi:PAS domain S-box-containing protein
MQGGIRVLLVDDDPAFVDLTATYLERIDDDIITLTETAPAAAVERVREERVDCVVSDYNMPSMNGLELFDEIREVDADLPFVLFTGRGSEEIASEAISAGVTDYIQKTTGNEQYEVLVNRIENAVSKHRAEREAAETNEQLGQIVDRISDAFFSIDRDWTIEFINERAAEYFGESRDALLGADLRDVLPEDRADRFYDLYREAFETQEPTTIQSESALRPGTRIEERVYPAADGLSVYFRDVTEREEMAEELRDTNRKITALHDVASAVTACDSEDDIYEVTIEAAEQILELDRCAVDSVEDSRLIPKAVSEGVTTDAVYHEKPIESDDSLGAETYRTGESVRLGDLQTAGYAPADSEYQSALSVPIGDHGIFQAVSSEPDAFTARDLELVELLASHVAVALTRLDSEQELRAERDRFATLFETIPHAVGRGAFEDGEPVVHEVNPRFERVFGVDSEEIAGESPDEHVVPPAADDEAAAINEQVCESGEVAGREVRRASADGVRDFLLHTVAADDGDAGEVFAIYTDITEQKRRERELERQNERLDDFASVLSHDIQTPLHVARSRLELAAAECDCTAPDREPVFDALDRIDDLVEDVLALAREGSRARDPKRVDLDAVATEAWQTAGTGAASLTVADDAPAVVADPSHLREVFENLFQNAVDHGVTSARVAGAPDEAPPVSVRVGALEDGFYVEDDGPGIPPEHRQDVFKRGYTTSEDGTGFGLAIVESVADTAGWTVSVGDAERAVRGTRFEFRGVTRAD